MSRPRCSRHRKYCKKTAHMPDIHHVRHRCRAGSQRYRNASRKHGQKSGRNNFKTCFSMPHRGKADGIKIIPLSEVATKDDFLISKAAPLTCWTRTASRWVMGGKPRTSGRWVILKKCKGLCHNELIRYRTGSRDKRLALGRGGSSALKTLLTGH